MAFSFDVKIESEEKVIEKIEEFVKKANEENSKKKNPDKNVGFFDRKNQKFSGKGIDGQYAVFKQNTNNKEEIFARITILNKPFSYPEFLVKKSIINFITS